MCLCGFTGVCMFMWLADVQFTVHGLECMCIVCLCGLQFLLGRGVCLLLECVYACVCICIAYRVCG